MVQYILSTGRTFDSKFVPNSLNVCTTAWETDMLFGHWFPPHTAFLARYINYSTVRSDCLTQQCGRLDLMDSFIIILVYFHVGKILLTSDLS